MFWSSVEDQQAAAAAAGFLPPASSSPLYDVGMGFDEEWPEGWSGSSYQIHTLPPSPLTDDAPASEETLPPQPQPQEAMQVPPPSPSPALEGAQFLTTAPTVVLWDTAGSETSTPLLDFEAATTTNRTRGGGGARRPQWVPTETAMAAATGGVVARRQRQRSQGGALLRKGAAHETLERLHKEHCNCKCPQITESHTLRFGTRKNIRRRVLTADANLRLWLSRLCSEFADDSTVLGLAMLKSTTSRTVSPQKVVLRREGRYWDVVAVLDGGRVQMWNQAPHPY